ncbi:MAG: outer membrane protein assembly factor BamD [Bauldia sp.]|nr:outer membrane protein assembly factor BamD [Bauldia sp.]
MTSSAAFARHRSRPFSVLFRVAAIAGALVLAGCVGRDDLVVEPAVPAADLYAEGIAAYEARRFGDAIDAFADLDRRYPYSEQGRRGLVLMADAQYNLSRWGESIASAERYLLLYPNGADADMALFLIGEAYLRQVPDVTRDQSAAARGRAANIELVERFPNSPYAEQARLNIVAVNDQLAGQEMLVGRYYQERRDYVAAINRFRVVVEEYGDTRHVEEALFRLTETYLAMGLVSEAQTAAAVLGHNFPNSSWYQQAYNLLGAGGLEPRRGGGWLGGLFRN